MKIILVIITSVAFGLAVYSIADEPLRKPAEKDDPFVIQANLQKLIQQMVKDNEKNNGETTEKDGVFVALKEGVENETLQEGQQIAAMLLSGAPERIPQERSGYFKEILKGPSNIEIIGWRGEVVSIADSEDGKQQIRILWRPTLKSKKGIAFTNAKWEETWELSKDEEASLVYKAGRRLKGGLVFVD